MLVSCVLFFFHLALVNTEEIMESKGSIASWVIQTSHAWIFVEEGVDGTNQINPKQNFFQ